MNRLVEKRRCETLYSLRKSDDCRHFHHFHRSIEVKNAGEGRSMYYRTYVEKILFSFPKTTNFQWENTIFFPVKFLMWRKSLKKLVECRWWMADW